MFADDVANCADTVARLQNQLDVIDAFCSKTGMQVNLEKSEIIVFRNGGPLRKSEKWFFRGQICSGYFSLQIYGIIIFTKIVMAYREKKTSSSSA